MLLLGAHVSITGGFDRAVDLANRLKCNCIQMFVKNQRQWRARPLTKKQVGDYLDALAESRQEIHHVVAHSAYLINLASDDASVRRKSVAALRDELKRCRALKIDRLVMHPGSHRGQGLAKGLDRVAAGLNRVLADVPGTTTVLLEVTAGAGDTIGGRLEHLAEIIARCEDPDRVGWGLDTCHLFAAGYALWPQGRFDALVAEIDDRIGCDRVGCIHLNDSVGEFGNRRDRHEHIGRGRISIGAFRSFLTEPRFATAPKIIETPKGPPGNLTFDRRNLRRLRKLYLQMPVLAD